MPKKKKKDRDIEKGYTNKQMVQSCVGLLTVWNRVNGSESRLLVIGSMFLPVQGSISSMREKVGQRKWSSSSNGNYDI